VSTMEGTVALVRSHDGRVWHILNDNADQTVCRWELPGDLKVELGIDRHVVKRGSYPVCSRCRRSMR